jgi:hypothetical protein
MTVIKSYCKQRIHCVFKEYLFNIPGVVHHDDLIYLFYISTLFPEFKNQDPESQMVEKLTQLWANFIQTGLVLHSLV